MPRDPEDVREDAMTDWRADALCHEYPNVVFFPGPPRRGERRDTYETARAVCHRCPVLDECLEDTLEAEADMNAEDVHGMFGGLTPNERLRIQGRRERSKPSTARPRPCSVCGKTFTPGYKAGHQHLCSPECKATHKCAMERERRAQRRRAA
jgi:WhiB family redox-sensing transcriptional regulator